MISSSDRAPSTGDEMSVQYSGYLASGFQFDSSYKRGMPYTFRFPPGNRAIVGWGLGMEGFTDGSRRKIVVPSELGYGERGNARANIAPNEPLYFNIHLEKLVTPEPAPEPGSAESASTSSDPQN